MARLVAEMAARHGEQRGIAAQLRDGAMWLPPKTGAVVREA